MRSVIEIDKEIFVGFIDAGDLLLVSIFFSVGDRNLILVTSFVCWCPMLIFKDSG